MKSLTDIFKGALEYPLQDYNILLVLGVIFLVSNLSSILINWNMNPGVVVLGILGLVSIILYFVVQGYSLSVIKQTVEGSDTVPPFNFPLNLIDGLKLLVVEIVYYIIPAILVIIIGFLTGTFSSIMNIVNYIGQQTTSTSLNATQVAQTIPTEYVTALFTGLTITVVIALILFIIFGLLLEIAMCRLAKYGTIGEAINFGEVIGDIKEIGLGRYIAWYVLLILITLVFSFVIALITAVPYIGIIVSFLICAPFIALFGSRALGNLYSDAR